MPEPVQRDVIGGGVRLRVAEAGSGPCVVLLHGVFFDHRTWEGLEGALSQEHRVICPDLPGFGQSEKPPPSRFPYGIEAFAEAVVDLYAGLEVGRAALVGHGLGGAVALTLAARHPELVSHLVLLSPRVSQERLGLDSRLARLPVLGNVVFQQLAGPGLFRSYFERRLLSPAAPRRADRIDAFYRAFNTPAARGSALATLRSASDTRTVMAQTSRVRAPTLIVWGRFDRLNPVRLGQRLAREIRGARLELLDAGHALQEERAGEIVELVLPFLREHRGASSS